MNNELPPWLALPEQVRDRALERYQKIYGHTLKEDTGETLEEANEALRDLSKYRLVKMFGLRKAINFAKTQDYPGGPFHRKDWKAACARAEERLIDVRDPSSREHLLGVRIAEIVQEELARWKKENF